MRTRNEEQFAKKRDEILQAAADCFVANGFHQTSMQEICLASNMSPGGLYRYFGSKSEIIHAIAEAKSGQFDVLIQNTENKKSPEKTIVAVLEAAIDNMVDLGPAALEVEIMSEAHRDAHVAQLLESRENGLRSFLESTIRKGKKAKKISKDVKANAVTSILVMFIRALSLQAAADPAFDPEKLKPHVRGVVRGLLRSETKKN